MTQLDVTFEKARISNNRQDNPKLSNTRVAQRKNIADYTRITDEGITRLYNSKSQDCLKVSPTSPYSKVAKYLMTLCTEALKNNASSIASELSDKNSNIGKLINHFKNGIIEKKTTVMEEIKRNLNSPDLSRDEIIAISKKIYEQFDKYLDENDRMSVVQLRFESMGDDRRILNRIIEKLSGNYRKEFDKRFKDSISQTQEKLEELLLSNKLNDVAISECLYHVGNAQFNKNTNTILIGRGNFKKNSAQLIATIGHELGHCILHNIKSSELSSFTSENIKIEEHLCDFIGHKIITNLPNYFKNDVSDKEVVLPFSEDNEKEFKKLRGKNYKKEIYVDHPANSDRNILFRRFFTKALLQDNSLKFDALLDACNTQVKNDRDNISNLIKEGDSTQIEIAFLKNPYLFQECCIEKQGINIIRNIISSKDMQDGVKDLICDILSANPDMTLDFSDTNDLMFFYNKFLKERPYFLNRVNNIEMISDVINKDAKLDKKILEALPVVFNNENSKFPIEITKENRALFANDALQTPLSFAYRNISQESLTNLLTEMLKNDDISYDSVCQLLYFANKGKTDILKCKITDENVELIAKFLLKDGYISHSGKFEGDTAELLLTVLKLDKENGFKKSARILCAFLRENISLKVSRENLPIISDFLKMNQSYAYFFNDEDHLLSEN